MSTSFPYNTVRAELTAGWNALQRILKTLDSVEKRVAEAEQPEIVRGRVTPFYIQHSIAFAPFETSPKHVSLLQSAERTTHVTSLTYAVSYDDGTGAQPDTIGQALVPRPKTLVRADPTPDKVDIFDFEWNFSLGSSERRYGNGRGTTAWLSRSALGSPTTRGALFFSEKTPLILRPNERFEFHARPLHYNLDPGRAFTGAERFYLHIVGTALRIFE